MQTDTDNPDVPVLPPPDDPAATDGDSVPEAGEEAAEPTILRLVVPSSSDEEGNAGDGDNGAAEEDEEEAEEQDVSEANDEEDEEAGDADASDAPDATDGTEEGPTLPIASIVEAVLFAAREPLKPAQIARAVGKGTRQDAVRAAVDELNVQYLESGRAFEVAEVSGRFQLMSRPEYVTHIMRIYPKREISEKDKTIRLTPAALDTLSIIAYKQPVTRGEIERIRGVGCGPVLRALIERGSVKVAGKKLDVVGQPLMYGTTEAFLAEFGLGSLDELPMRNEFLGVMGEPEAPPPPSEPESKPEPQPEENDIPIQNA